MWAKDDYQEQMLSYLDWVQGEIAQLEQAHTWRNDLDELYDNLEVALERLWRLIKATDLDWETFRYPLELSCDTLLHTFYRTPYADTLMVPVHFIITDNHETNPRVWEPAQRLT